MTILDCVVPALLLFYLAKGQRAAPMSAGKLSYFQLWEQQTSLPGVPMHQDEALTQGCLSRLDSSLKSSLSRGPWVR